MHVIIWSTPDQILSSLPFRSCIQYNGAIKELVDYISIPHNPPASVWLTSPLKFYYTESLLYKWKETHYIKNNTSIYRKTNELRLVGTSCAFRLYKYLSFRLVFPTCMCHVFFFSSLLLTLIPSRSCQFMETSHCRIDIIVFIHGLYIFVKCIFPSITKCKI